MTQKNKLAVFDIDGTIALNGTIPESVILGIKNIQDKGFLTTVSTGRGYLRMKEALGTAFDTIISPESFIIIEHGTKIVDREGNVVKADYFKPNEIDHIVDFSRANADMIKLLIYTSPDPKRHAQAWCKSPDDIPAELKRRGHYADVFHCSYEELKKRLLEYPVSVVSAKLQEHIVVENLKLHFAHGEIDIIFQNSMMEYIGNIADKAQALLYLEKHYSISVENMLVAGNAINDVDMLNLAAGRRILVGSEREASSVIGHLTKPDEIIRIGSPEELGMYLQSITA